MWLQVHGNEGQFLNSANASCAQPEAQELMHEHAQCCAAAELEVCIAKKEAAVADAAVAAVAKVGLHLLLTSDSEQTCDILVERCHLQHIDCPQNI